MRKRRVSHLLLALAGVAAFGVCAAAAAEEGARPQSRRAAECARTLLSGPDGAPVGCLDDGAQVRVQERVPGWYRVQVEGWLRESEAQRLPAAGGRSALAGTAVGPAGQPAAGALARLLGHPDELERALAELRQRHEAERRKIDQKLQDVDKALSRALFSSDNLTEASLTRSRLRNERHDLEEQRAALRRRGLDEASALFERYQVLTVTSDAEGFFLLEGVDPGSYRLLVSSGPPGDAPAWYVPVTLASGERRRVDLSVLQTRQDPFTPFN